MKTHLCFCLFLLLLVPNLSFSQVGIGTNTPEGILDISSSTQGLVTPKVSLVLTTQALPVVNPNGGSIAQGTLVYNTASVNDVIPGYYYWNISKWVRISESPETLTFTSVALPSGDGTNDDVDLLLNTTNFTKDVFRITHATSGDAEITGIDGGVHGRLIYLYNGDGSDNIKIVSDGSSGSAAANRFSIDDDFSLLPGNGVVLAYDGISLNRWVVFRSDN